MEQDQEQAVVEEVVVLDYHKALIVLHHLEQLLQLFQFQHKVIQ